MSVSTTDEEIDISGLATYIFSEEPHPMRSVRVDFDVSEVEPMFNRLMELFHLGTLKLFGDEHQKVNLMKLSKTDIELLESCMLSIGIRVTLKRCKLEDVYRLQEHMFGLALYDPDMFKDAYPEEDTFEYDSVDPYDVVHYTYQTSRRLSDWRYTTIVSDIYYMVVYFEYLPV